MGRVARDGARRREPQVGGAGLQEFAVGGWSPGGERRGAGGGHGRKVAAFCCELLAQEFEFVHAADFTMAAAPARRVAK
mgnify:CR=1 FL=1